MKGIVILKSVTVINVLTAAGFAIAGLCKPTFIVASYTASDNAANVFALYAAARAVPLAVITLFMLPGSRKEQLLVLGLLAGCIQLVDGCIGLYLHDLSKIIGPFVLAGIQFAAWYFARKGRSLQGNK